MKRALVAVMLVFASPAAADPPRVVTGPADVVAPVIVNGSGTINDGGRAGTWWFEFVAPWGPEYDFTTPAQDLAGAPGDQPVSSQLGTIATGTTYRYRLVFQAADGVTYGDWVEFTTPDVPVIKSFPPVPRLEFSSRPLWVARDNTIGLLLGCRSGATPCKGTIAIKDSDVAGAHVVTRRKRFTIPAGRWARVRVTLVKGGRRLIGDGLLAFVEVRGVDGATSRTGTSRQLAVRGRG